MSQHQQDTYTTWNPRTLHWICCNKNAIKEVANKLGLSPEAIAGIMAKENDSYVKDPVGNILTDDMVQLAGFDHVRP